MLGRLRLASACPRLGRRGSLVLRPSVRRLRRLRLRLGRRRLGGLLRRRCDRVSRNFDESVVEEEEEGGRAEVLLVVKRIIGHM